MSTNTACSPPSVPSGESKSTIKGPTVVLKRIEVDRNDNVAKSSKIVHVDLSSDDDFVKDDCDEVRNMSFQLHSAHGIKILFIKWMIRMVGFHYIYSPSIRFGPVPSRREPSSGSQWTARSRCLTPSAARPPLHRWRQVTNLSTWNTFQVNSPTQGSLIISFHSRSSIEFCSGNGRRSPEVGPKHLFNVGKGSFFDENFPILASLVWQCWY